MPQFNYWRPSNLEEALDRLKDNDGFDVVLWGGGTSTAQLLKQKLIAPGLVVDLKALPELQGIAQTDAGDIAIGAYTRLREIEKSALLQRILPCLPAAAGLIGNVRVRNAATLGGHLVHADPAQDLPPLLLVLDAELRLRSQSGERTVPIAEFFVDTMETAIRPDEVMTQAVIPRMALSARSRYVKFAPRSREDYATVGAAASLRFAEDGRTVEEARIAVGGADATALRFPEAEAVVAGKALSPELCRQAAELVAETVQPWDDGRGSADYKRAMSKVWIERVLLSLREGQTI